MKLYWISEVHCKSSIHMLLCFMEIYATICLPVYCVLPKYQNLGNYWKRENFNLVLNYLDSHENKSKSQNNTTKVTRARNNLRWSCFHMVRMESYCANIPSKDSASLQQKQSFTLFFCPASCDLL